MIRRVSGTLIRRTRPTRNSGATATDTMPTPMATSNVVGERRGEIPMSGSVVAANESNIQIRNPRPPTMPINRREQTDQQTLQHDRSPNRVDSQPEGDQSHEWSIVT